MWYWIGIAFVAFLVLFEVFRADQTPVVQNEDVKIASAITLRNAAQRFSYDSAVVTAGEKTASMLADYLPDNVKIPDDHKVSIRCVTTADLREEMQCSAPGGLMYMITYVPMDFETPADRQTFLKNLYEKTGGLKGAGLWRASGEIETFSGIRSKVPEIFGALRLTLPVDVFVILDKKATASCPPPFVSKYWTSGCKCPDGMKQENGTCIACGNTELPDCIEKIPGGCDTGTSVCQRIIDDAQIALGQSFASGLFTGAESDGFTNTGIYYVQNTLVADRTGYYFSREKRVSGYTWINALTITTEDGKCRIQENYYTNTGNYAVEISCPPCGQATEITKQDVPPANRLTAISDALAEYASRFATFFCGP